MKTVVMMVALLLLAAPALAQQRGPNDPMNVKLFGEWEVISEPNRFDGGDTVVAVVGGREGSALAVRCIQRQLSILLVDPARPYREGDDAWVQIRVDGGSIITSAAGAIDRDKLQLPAELAMVRQLMAGKEVAFRVDRRGLTFDRVYRLGRAKEALAPVVAACPIE